MVKVRDAKLKDREASQDFIRTSKKHRNQVWLAFAILVIFYVACSAFYVGYRYKKQPVFEPTDFDEAKMDASYRPNGAKLTDIVIPNSEDKDAMIACALKLYNKANYNLQHDNAVAYAVHTNTEVLKVPTGGIRYTIKNGDEFFNADYFYVPSNAGTMGSIAKAASPEYTNYGYRRYYNKALNIGREQKAKELSYKTQNDGQILFSVNWSDLYFDQEIEMPQEFAESRASYKYYNFTWDTDTIKSATVEYNEEEGYYKLVVELDASNKKTVKDAIKDLQNGAGDKNAKYTKIVETIEIWDNGRYKTFNTKDDWESPRIHGMRISTSSYNDYRTTFYYDDYSLNISNYQYAKEYIETLTK